MIKIIIEEDFNKIYDGPNNSENDEKMPLSLRIIFPIISPIYYLLGTPILIIFVNKLSNKLSDFIMERLDKDFLIYFLFVMRTFDKAINNLKDISITFKNQYVIGDK